MTELVNYEFSLWSPFDSWSSRDWEEAERLLTTEPRIAHLVYASNPLTYQGAGWVADPITFLVTDPTTFWMAPAKQAMLEWCTFHNLDDGVFAQSILSKPGGTECMIIRRLDKKGVSYLRDPEGVSNLYTHVKHRHLVLGERDPLPWPREVYPLGDNWKTWERFRR